MASSSLRARQDDARRRFQAAGAGAYSACQEQARELELLRQYVGERRARIEQLEAFLDTLHVPVDADIDDVLAVREMIAHGMVIALKQAVEMGMQVRGDAPFVADVVALADMVKPTRQQEVGRRLFSGSQRKRKKKRKR
ncbi:hypothetical protein BRL54_11035 [Corynebacterium ulcerans]|nr:hypothetical protein BRL54_11035 [Corynebacterium ulcerans]